MELQKAMPKHHSSLDEHQQKIKELYIDQGLPLRLVVERLRLEDNCHASLNMYRKKLQHWGLHKNTKQRDKPNLQPVASSCSGPTMFEVRDRTVKSPDMDAYLRRRVSGKKQSTGIVHGEFLRIQNRYRSISPPMLPDDLRSCEHFFYITREVQTHILSPLQLPQDLQATDQPLQAVLDRRNALRSTSYNHFFREFSAGTFLVTCGRYKEAFAMFERGFRLLADALHAQGPGFLASTITLLFVADSEGAVGLAEMITKNLWHRSYVDFGPNHYLTVWGQLLHQHHSNHDVLASGLVAGIDSTIKILGPYDEWAIANRFSFLSNIERCAFPLTISVEQVCDKFSNLIEDFDKSLKTMPRLLWTIKRFYAQYLRKIDTATACEVLDNLANQLEVEFDDLEDAIVILFAFPAYCFILYAHNAENYTYAEDLLKRAMKKSHKLLGEGHTLTQTLLFELARFHELKGDLETAQQEFDELSTALEKYTISSVDGRNSEQNPE